MMHGAWRGRSGAHALRFVAGLLLVAAVASGAVMVLWNALLPAVLDVAKISYWQVLGLLVLARLLFGRWHGPAGHMAWRRHMMERWQQMTPEERERMRAGWSQRCGPRRADVGESSNDQV